MTDDLDKAAYRERARRLAIQARISSEEWARAEGFPYHPRWVIPAGTALLFVVAGAAAVWLATLPSAPRQIDVTVIQGPAR